MKLRNKKTGNIIETDSELNIKEPTSPTFGCPAYNVIASYNSLAELNEEWEDYEEPKELWWLDNEGNVNSCKDIDEYCFARNKQIGNYFETQEEAEKAVEKLKAWKRLKDKGFRFCGWATNEGIRGVDFEAPDSFFSEHNHSCISDETREDLDLLFGGEE